jgi:hypothetical protein
MLYYLANARNREGKANPSCYNLSSSQRHRTHTPSRSSTTSLPCVCMRPHPTDPATRHRRPQNSRQLQIPRRQSSVRSRLGSGSDESILRGIGTTPGRLRGWCLIMGSLRRSTGHKPCAHRRSGREKAEEQTKIGYCASRGFVTLLNSRQAKVPPGLRTRCASRRTSGMEVTFRMPNAMV